MTPSCKPFYGHINENVSKITNKLHQYFCKLRSKMSIRLVTQVSALQKKILVRQFEPYSIMTARMSRNYNLNASLL